MENEKGHLLYFDGNDSADGYATLSAILQTDWQPYREEKEIRPENAGELWEKRDCFYHTSGSQYAGGLTLHGDVGTVDIASAIHGKNGWTRLFPHVEEDVERIEIEGVKWSQRTTSMGTFVYPFKYNVESIELVKLIDRRPMKMILEIPKDKP